MGNYRNFKLVIYCVADSLAKATEASLEQQIAFFQRHVQPDKVYVESYRDNVLVSREQLAMVRAVFARHGIETAGGITTTIADQNPAQPKQRIFNTFCYTDPAMRARMKEIVEHTAAAFDEFIIDDFYFTNCTCDSCRAQRGERSWERFRLDLMAEVSENLVLKPAKAVNPNCRVTIKYPNWVESFQEAGYNPGVQKDQFDMIYTGTETRHPVHTHQHLPRYLSFSLMRWMENLAPGRNGGGWLDPYGCYPLDTYLEQAYLTVFSRPREVMLFCWHSLYDTVFVPPLGFQLHKLDELMDHAGQPVGIPVYHPANSQGEDHLEDYLGMLGIPFEPVPAFPASAPAVFLTASAACDADIVEKLEAYVTAGGRAVVSSGFVRATLDKGLARMTSMRDRGRRVTAVDYMVEPVGGWMMTIEHGIQPVTLPVLEYRNNTTWCQVKAIAGDENFGLLMRDTYGQGSMTTLVVPDNFAELKRLPQPVLTRIRQAFYGDLVLDAPAQIGLFAYDNDVFALYPFVADGAQPHRVHMLARNAAALHPLGSTRPAIQPLYTRGETAVFELLVFPGQFSFYRVERGGAQEAAPQHEVRSAPPA